MEYLFETHYKGYVRKINEVWERLRIVDWSKANQNFSEYRTLKVEESFSVKDLKRHHLDLIKAVFDHNTFWGKRLITRQASNPSLMGWLLSIASPVIGWGVGRAYRRLFGEIVASASLPDQI